MNRFLIVLIVISLNVFTMHGQTLYVPEADGSVPGLLKSTITGKIGIGLNAPAGKLHIESTPNTRGSQLLVTESLSNRHILYTSSTDGRAMYYMYNGTGTLMNYFDTNGKNYITGGNFGIGTNDPSELVELAKDLNPTLKFNSYGNYTGDIGTIKFVTYGTEKAKIVASKHNAVGGLTDLLFYVGGGSGSSNYLEKMRIGYNGTTYFYNETNPAIIELNRKYDLLGDIGILNFTMNGYNLASIRASRTVEQGMLTDLIFATGGSNSASEKMRLTNNGNLLIGKATQLNSNYKLDVAGPIRADEIVVNTDGADFVFEPTYNLRSLNELEAFIKEHKHLPEIAPAKEMQENGISAGEMQTKLLQKVEELTLYLIEQSKSQAEQNKMIDDQIKVNAILLQKIEQLEKQLNARN